MNATPLSKEQQVVVLDFEFRPIGGLDGNPLEIICGVFKDIQSGISIRLWQEELREHKSPPLCLNDETTLVAYYASAEMSCFRTLGWPRRYKVIDLFAEFRVLTNGLLPRDQQSLIAALTHFGGSPVTRSHKEVMRSLALRGGPYTEQEKGSLLEYCLEDVEMTEQLYLAMIQWIDYPRALIRGAFCIPLAEMEAHGSPLDYQTLNELRQSWDAIKAALIDSIDRDFKVYENGSFKEDLFESYLLRHRIQWPRLASGRLQLDEETFKEMTRAHPNLKPLRTLRESLSKLRLAKLQAGTDGRNRCLLSPFGASTGRNTPSTSKFIFGWPKWARGLIQPKPGQSIAYIDFSQQEFGVAAALSGDQNMAQAYRSDDPYLQFAIQAGAVPSHATRTSHPNERDQFKQCVLATQYGMEARGLAQRINQPVIRARQLLAQHRRIYRKFWDWSDNVFHDAISKNKIQTLYGWRLQLMPEVNPRSIRNFPMQASAAEMLRVACILIHERGIQLCAPVHDALLIEAPDCEITKAAAIAKDCMTKASEIVLDGFSLDSDVRILTYPERFLDEDSQPFWDQVMTLMARAKEKSSENCNTKL
jgi:DNA polymerase I-like protein with 3'-5' exonuclease and polymerase domains